MLAGVSLVVLIVSAVGGLGDIKKEIVTRIPDGTVFALQNNQFSVSPEAQIKFGGDGPDYLFVIDSKITSVDTKTSAPGLVVFGQKAVFAQSLSGDGYSTMPYRLPNFSVSKQGLIDFVQKYGWLFLVVWAIMFVTGIMIYFWLVNMVMVLALSSIAGSLSTFMKITITFRQWLAMGFYAITLPAIIGLGLSFFNVSIPYLFSGIFVLFAVAIAIDERQQPTQPKVEIEN